MKKRNYNWVVVKPYLKGQLQLPTDLESLIPTKHVVRVVDTAINKMDLGSLLRQYKGDGTSSYHPGTMLIGPGYTYSRRIYSSWQFSKALRENVAFMWLSGNSRPDFPTVNRFRGRVMRARSDSPSR